MEEDKLGEERAAQRGRERVLAKARAQRKRREQQRQVGVAVFPVLSNFNALRRSYPKGKVSDISWM